MAGWDARHGALDALGELLVAAGLVVEPRYRQEPPLLHLRVPGIGPLGESIGVESGWFVDSEKGPLEQVVNLRAAVTAVMMRTSVIIEAARALP